MIQRRLNILKGIRCGTETGRRKQKHDRFTSNTRQDEIEICLTCNKSADECNGDCKLTKRGRK